MLPAFLAFSIVPIGGVVTIAGHRTFLQLADLPFGILWLLAMSGLGLYGVLLAGWSSGSKYPLLGSVRASAQLLSYEAAFGLAIVGVLVQANTLSTRAIVIQQGWDGFKSIFNGDWYWLPAIVALVIFVIAAVAETNHPPFDLVEAEQELTGGFFTEYTGIKFAIFYLAEFMNVITMCAIAVTLFFGGPYGPGLGFLPANGWFNAWIMPVFWFMFKVILLLFGTVWLRASLPRLRYDQLMALGWKFLIEVAFLWVMISGVVIVAKEEGWSMWIVLPSAIVGALAVGGDALRLGAPPRRGLGRDPMTETRIWADGLAQRVRRSPSARSGARRSPSTSPRRSGRSRCASTAATSSTATRTAWRSASAASCARACARRSASTCAAPTTRPTRRCRRASATASSTRSTTCAASTATCASRRAPPRRSPRRSCSSSRSPDREDAIYTKTELLVDDDGRARRQPWELWLGGEDDDTSAWMRATAPSGQAVYEGRVGWSGELGFGVRPPEVGQSATEDESELTEPAPAEPVATHRHRARRPLTHDRGRSSSSSPRWRSSVRWAWCWRATRCTRRCSLVSRW